LSSIFFWFWFCFFIGFQNTINQSRCICRKRNLSNHQGFCPPAIWHVHVHDHHAIHHCNLIHQQYLRHEIRTM
jgi:hypothetical protein